MVGRRIVVSQDALLEAAMVSWLEELDRREAAAREEISEPCDRIEVLTGHLAEQEEVLSRLEITRETMTEILSGDEAVTGLEIEPGDTGAGDAGPAEASRQLAKEEESRFRVGSPVGVRLVPELAVGRCLVPTRTSLKSSKTRSIRRERITSARRWGCRRTRARWRISGRS